MQFPRAHIFPLNPRIKQLCLNQACIKLPCPLTTWARARHKVCSITQVFSKAERAAMVPLPYLSLLGSPNPLFSLLFPLPYSSPGRHSEELVGQSCLRGGGMGVMCTAPKKSTQEQRAECGEGWRDGGMRGSSRWGGCRTERGVILPPQPAPESTSNIPYAPINIHAHTHSRTHLYTHTQNTYDFVDWGQSKFPKCAYFCQCDWRLYE